MSWLLHIAGRIASWWGERADLAAGQEVIDQASDDWTRADGPDPYYDKDTTQ